MPDGWEVENNLNQVFPDGLEDKDTDLLLNFEEYQQGTDPNNPDTDTDGLLDGEEVHVHETNPLSIDTDGDQMPDKWEVENNLNPTIDDSYLDADNDKLTNLREYLLGKDPHLWDNSLLLYCGYLLPVWIVYLVAFVFTGIKLTRMIKSKRRGFFKFTDFKSAESLGFVFSEDYYLAIQLGFTTNEQWQSAIKAGFFTEDQWIEAQQKGFSDSRSMKDVETIGFSDYHDFRNTIQDEINEFRMLLGSLVDLLVEIEEKLDFTKDEMIVYERTIEKLSERLDNIKENLKHLTQFSSKDYNLDKLIITELKRKNILIEKSRKILETKG